MTNHQIAMNFILFNENFYNSMSAEDQAVVDEACKAFVQKQLELFQKAMVMTLRPCRSMVWKSPIPIVKR